MTSDESPSPGHRLRTLIAGDELIVAPGVFDGLSAQLVRRAGFRAAYLTGAGVAAAGFGLPDIGLTTQTEMAERARMVGATLGDVPLIADADTGYGSVLQVVRTVEVYEAAGVAAVQLEDQAFPKRCGHLPAKELIGADAFATKLTAALDARRDPGLVIIARTDARGPAGVEEAIDRARRYAKTGADVIFVEAPQSTEEIERIAAEVDAPLLLNLPEGGLTPEVSGDRLAELGFRIAIHPTTPLMAAANAMVDSLEALGGRRAADGPQITPADLFRLVGLDEWFARDERYRRPDGA